ncbi:hypothetical protein [Actinomadura sp. 21ATH]|uniref:hypothetical protein n=1 Tax=Actinomadura sp. 21ATH TaxID=1735444 RepID=UPI0035C04E5F
MLACPLGVLTGPRHLQQLQSAIRWQAVQLGLGRLRHPRCDVLLFGGTWARILAALQTRADAAGLIGWQVGVDSTVVRAHQHAAGARRHADEQSEPPGGTTSEPGDHALGRSRGGLSTKLHLACEQGQKPLSLVVTAVSGATPRSSRR